jgi:hypothetical protein
MVSQKFSSLESLLHPTQPSVKPTERIPGLKPPLAVLRFGNIFEMTAAFISV